MTGMMAGTMMPPPPAPAAAGATVGAAGKKISASLANSFRVHAVAERLNLHVQPGFESNPTEFFGLCLSLARGIDFAVANNETLLKVQELPFLLKQVCHRKGDVFLQAAVMVLMASVKNACVVGWFEEKETEELLTLVNEIGKAFSSSGDINAGKSDSLSIIPTVMSRFYPLMKMGQILVSLEVKPGFGTHVIDFHISKATRNSPQDKIRLFVAQTDNTETAACIVTPQEVNFLLNGKGVERRTNVMMDTGPQMPTNVTGMLKYGTNLLQAVGQFKGHYVIVVAFMSVEPIPETPILQDHAQPCEAERDPDADIIEGPSRISLNCPISYTRIKTPVKGHSCKHLQCFDFSNFIDINTRRPSWRCPHCNQHVCYMDIRVDQNMVKVLREMGENVSDVIISADGSLKAVSESEDKVDQTGERTLHCEKDMPEQVESTTTTRAIPMVMDLTVNDDDEMGVVGGSDAEDRKPFLANLQNHHVDSIPIPTMPSQLINANEPNQNFSTQLADDFWSSYTSDVQMVNGFSEPSAANFMTSPVITDAVSPALNRDIGGYGNTTTSSVMHNQLSASSNSQSLQQQFVNSVANSEYGTMPPVYHLNRAPIAVQALPARPQTPAPQQRSRTHTNPSISSGTSLTSLGTPPTASTANGLHSVSGNMDRQQLFARSHNTTSSSLQHNSTAQNWNRQGHSSMRGQSAQEQVVTPPSSSQLAGAHRASSQNLLYQQALRVPPSRSQSPNVVRSSSPLAPPRVQQGVAQVGVGNSAGATNSQQTRLSVAAQITPQRARQPPSVPVQIQTSRAGASHPASADGIRAPAIEQRGNVGGALPAVSGTEGLLDLAPEWNWRPTGRMRGSLSGQAYSAAFKEFMIRPTQQTQAPRPPSSVPPSQSRMPPHLQARYARSAQVPQAQNSPVTGSTFLNGSS